jgi:hypothetical protein
MQYEIEIASKVTWEKQTQRLKLRLERYNFQMISVISA